MSEYTPTTQQVEHAYANDAEAEYRDPVNYSALVRTNKTEFRRWLAAHDAEVTAKALERGVDELGVYVGDEDGDYWTGYRDGQRRQIHVLKMLAAESRADTTNNESEDE